MIRRIGLAVIAASVAAVALWMLGGAPGADAVCAPACDCETIGSGAVAQPANAWTALAIAAAGLWAALRGRGGASVLGSAVALVGLASFAAHASVAAWAYRTEGAALAGAAWAAAGVGDRRWVMVGWAAGAAGGWVLDAPWSLWLAGAGIAAAAAGPVVRAMPPRLLAAASFLLAGGAALRFLADDGGPWCRPDAAVGGHALWHLLAAAGLALLTLGIRRSTGADLPSGPSPASTGR